MSGFTRANIRDLEDIVATRGSAAHTKRWEAREIWSAVDARNTGALHIRLHPGKRSPFTHRQRFQ